MAGQTDGNILKVLMPAYFLGLRSGGIGRVGQEWGVVAMVEFDFGDVLNIENLEWVQHCLNCGCSAYYFHITIL